MTLSRAPRWGHRIAFGLVAATILLLAGGPAREAAGAEGELTFSRHSAPYTLANAASAAEPTVGVDWRTGAVMFQSWSSTYRVLFDDLADPPVATWTDVTPRSSIINLDPILFTDSITGRTFAGGLNGACSVLSFTDDDGATWTPMGNTCAGAGVDHPSIASGPWTEAPPLTARSDRAVYYCAQSSVVQCATSFDGGLTFAAGTTVTCGFFNPGFHGSVHVAPNGWVYLPFRTCGGTNGVAVSKDNGLTWQGRAIPTAVNPPKGFDPDVGSTTSGWAYVAYPTVDYGVGVALTKDGGATWADFGDVAASAGIMSATFLEMVAGDDERAAVVYLGSTTDGEPHDLLYPGKWYVHVTYTLDGGATWRTVRASDNIAQWGWICSDGTDCTAGRNLLEFIDAQLDRDGRIVIAYADGCGRTCELGYGASASSYATILRQSGGDTLFATLDRPMIPDPVPQHLPELTEEGLRAEAENLSRDTPTTMPDEQDGP